MITTKAAALRFESGFWFEMQVQINNIEIIKRELQSDYSKKCIHQEKHYQCYLNVRR